MVKKRMIYAILIIFLFLLVFITGCKCFYGDIYLEVGGEGRHVWKIQDLQEVSKDFEFQTDTYFLSASPDPWFDIAESFHVRTIVIDINDISEIHDSQIFYYSDDQNLDEKFSYYFKLNKGLNYLQIPKGNYNKFRLDLTDTSGVTLGINSITVYGNRCVSSRLLVGIAIIWLVIIRIIYSLMFRNGSDNLAKGDTDNVVL